MEYYRTDDGQIQADFARRLGRVLKQYHNAILPEEKYEVTLCLSVLQSLLTNCSELIEALSKKERRQNPLITALDKSVWGFDERDIVQNTFHHPRLKTWDVLKHMRNALSHPTKIDLAAKIKSTGYTTLGTTPSIEKVVFISSPDILASGSDKRYSEKTASDLLTNGTFPPRVKLRPIKEYKVGFALDSEPFYRVFQIQLSVEQLTTLTYALATYLSNPLRPSWDGNDFIVEKIAA